MRVDNWVETANSFNQLRVISLAKDGNLKVINEELALGYIKMLKGSALKIICRNRMLVARQALLERPDYLPNIHEAPDRVGGVIIKLRQSYIGERVLIGDTTGCRYGLTIVNYNPSRLIIGLRTAQPVSSEVRDVAEPLRLI